MNKEAIRTLEEAMVYIDELEKNLKEAISLVMKRDDQLTVAERRIFELESSIEELEAKRKNSGSAQKSRPR